MKVITIKCFSEYMTKTHTADNGLLTTVQSQLRTLDSRGVRPDGGREIADKVLASKSLFELADALHLGRSRTRALLNGMASRQAVAIERATSKEVK